MPFHISLIQAGKDCLINSLNKNFHRKWKFCLPFSLFPDHTLVKANYAFLWKFWLFSDNSHHFVKKQTKFSFKDLKKKRSNLMVQPAGPGPSRSFHLYFFSLECSKISLRERNLIKIQLNSLSRVSFCRPQFICWLPHFFREI